MDHWNTGGRWRSRAILLACVIVAGALCISNRHGSAYTQYSQNGGDATNCGSCHGDFRATSYISSTDGMNWGNLHNLHRNTMLGGDCDACHGANDLPVILDSSNGGDGLDPIGCVGCHGRAEDNVAGNPELAADRSGYGAGLRQHHEVAGVTVCSDCHLDTTPASYTPVGENIPPVYYANPGNNHPSMPNDACNLTGGEHFAGIPQGLDNDGDDLYDSNDTDCVSPVEDRSWGTLKSLFR
jgi:hypothetical protein